MIVFVQKCAAWGFVQEEPFTVKIKKKYFPSFNNIQQT